MKKIFLLGLIGSLAVCNEAWTGQSCNYVNDSDGNRVWRCKNTDSSGNITSWSDVNDDLYRSYDADMNIKSYGVFTKKLDDYGNKTEWIQVYYQGNPNDDVEDTLTSKSERFYTYTDHSRNNNTFWDVKYQSYKEINYGANGVPQNEWHTTYSDDGLTINKKEVYYTNGKVTRERGYTYTSTCPYDDISVSTSRCRDRTLTGSWEAYITDGKITSKSYYDDWFGNLLYTSTFNYNSDGSYEEVFSDGRREKYNADGSAYVRLAKRIYTVKEATEASTKGSKNKFSIRHR